MATHPRILAWRIPWTEEPGGLESTGLQSRTRLVTTTFQVVELSEEFVERRNTKQTHNYLCLQYQSVASLKF